MIAGSTRYNTVRVAKYLSCQYVAVSHTDTFTTCPLLLIDNIAPIGALSWESAYCISSCWLAVDTATYSILWSALNVLPNILSEHIRQPRHHANTMCLQTEHR